MLLWIGEDEMPKKIMIVDDSPEIAFGAKFSLEKIDSEFQVISAESGEKCFELLNNNLHPDLILLDIMMPEMNGWRVYQELRKHSEWKKIPVVFLTAKTDSCSKSLGKTLGQAFMEKPFDPQELKHRIDQILDNPQKISGLKDQIIEDTLKAFF